MASLSSLLAISSPLCARLYAACWRTPFTLNSGSKGRLAPVARRKLDLLSLTGGGEQPLTRAGQYHRRCVANAFSGPGLEAVYRDDIARFHRVACPPCPQEPVRTSHLHGPVRDLASFVLDVDVEPHVRVGPLDFRDSPGHLDGLTGVELRRKRVMRTRRHRGGEQPEADDNRKSRSHGRPSNQSRTLPLISSTPTR